MYQRNFGKRQQQLKKDNDLKIATWNVTSLNRPGALRTVDGQLEKYRVDIAAVQEIRWKGCGSRESRKYIVYYSCKPNECSFGTGFAVSKRLRGSVIGFKAVDERMCVLRIKGVIFNISLICAHAPTEDKEEEMKEQFYDKLSVIYDECPKADIKIVLGDFNAKIGREACFYQTIGKHSLHETSNDNGIRIIDFAASLNLVVKSTWFEHKNIHKATWISPDGNTRNQIDHILIDGRHFSSILDARTFRGADCDTDHMLVVGRFRARISNEWKQRGARSKKWDIEKLAIDEEKLRYQTAIASRVQGRGEEEEESVESIWATIKGDILAAAEEVVGFCETRRSSDWFDNECEVALKEREDARKKFLQTETRTALAAFAEQRKKSRKIVKAKKREKEQRRLQALEEQFQRSESRRFFREVNALRKGFQPRLSICKDRNGDVLCAKEAIINRWEEYFDGLLNEASREEEALGIATELELLTERPYVEPPTYEETRDAILSLKNNKAPGSDTICAEMLKQGGEDLWRRMHKLVAKIWADETIPEDWNVGIICPLYKKGDKLTCSNYRGITLLSSVYKVFSTVLLNRIKPLTEDIIGEYQCGFRGGRSTTDQIFSVRQIMEKMWEYGVDIYQLFIDFKQAYDSVNRNALWSAMVELGLPTKYIRLVRASLVGAKSCVRVQNDLSETFAVTCGLRQGDALSPILFNIALEKVIRMANLDKTGTIFHKSKQIVAYADDIDIVSRSEAAAKDAFSALEVSAAAIGLSVNEGKTKFMAMTRKRATTSDPFEVGDYAFEQVQSFDYLGVSVNSKNDVSEEIKSRITSGNRCLFGLASIFRSKACQRGTKLRIYKAILRPVVLYGAEAWTLSQADEQALGTFERRVLRKIYGPIRDSGDVWRSRYNHELKALYTEPDLVAVAKSSRLRWAGHLLRMEKNCVTRKVFESTPYGNKMRGRPRTKWISNIEVDLGRIGVRDWKTRAQDRTKWRGVVEEAKTHLGL